MAENNPLASARRGAPVQASCRSTSAKRPRSYAAYMPFLQAAAASSFRRRGQYSLGEEVFMLLSLMDDPNRIAVQGKVVWITPDGVQGNRTQGIGVQFTLDETGRRREGDDRADPRRASRRRRARRTRCDARALR